MAMGSKTGKAMVRNGISLKRFRVDGVFYAVDRRRVISFEETHLEIHAQGNRHDRTGVERDDRLGVAFRPGDTFVAQCAPKSFASKRRIDDQHADNRPALLEERSFMAV